MLLHSLERAGPTAEIGRESTGERKWGGGVGVWGSVGSVCHADPIAVPSPSPPPLQELPALLLEATKELEAARQQVLKRIQIWKRQQQLAGNGALFEENLTPLQKRWGGGRGASGDPRYPPNPWGRRRPVGLWGSGRPFPVVSRRCEGLVEVHFQLHQQVMAAGAELGAELLSQLLERLNEVLSSLVRR